MLDLVQKLLEQDDSAQLTDAKGQGRGGSPASTGVFSLLPPLPRYRHQLPGKKQRSWIWISVLCVVG